MTPSRLLDRPEWEAELQRYGCTRLEGKTSLNTAEFWRAPWVSYPFTVPVEDGRISQDDFQRVVAMLMAQAPDGWSFE